LRRIAVSALRERIGDVFTHVAVRRERIVLTRHGRELGAIVPMEDFERLRALEAGEDEDGPMTPYQTSWRRLTDAIHKGH
jgi:prevent-host-death family protein